VAWYIILTLIRQIRSSIRGKAVFVTGCDSGFGNMVAKQLDAQGVRVYAGCFTAEGRQTLEKEMSENSRAIRLDISDDKSVEDAAELVRKECADTGLYGLINNAGIYDGNMIELTPMSVHRKVMEVNFWGMVRCSTALLPLLKKAKGRIVTVTSTSGLYAGYSHASYAAAKHASEAFNSVLRQEMKVWGVQLSIIEPGFHKTGMLTQVSGSATRMLEASAKSTDRDLKESARNYGGTWVEEAEAPVKRFMGLAKDPQNVVNAMKHALTAYWPHHRYMVGYDSKFFCIVMSAIPSWISDWIVLTLISPPVPVVLRAGGAAPSH
jgi:NAD(P)-dependent dehydrogenase (short-subunit alcohol dehydrogenase family)